MDLPYLSQALRELPRPLAVHVSDTPSQSYTFLFRLFRQLEPEYLIHTGDMVDEIKLEVRPSQVDAYKTVIGKFIQEVESLNFREIYIVPGNHDHVDTIVEASARSVVLPEKSWARLEGYDFFLSHHYDETEVEADFYLFGHNFPEDTGVRGKTLKLNGLSAIHVISLEKGRVVKIPYPMGTDSARTMLLPKIGL